MSSPDCCAHGVFHWAHCDECDPGRFREEASTLRAQVATLTAERNHAIAASDALEAALERTIARLTAERDAEKAENKRWTDYFARHHPFEQELVQRAESAEAALAAATAALVRVDNVVKAPGAAPAVADPLAALKQRLLDFARDPKRGNGIVNEYELMELLK